MIHRDVAASEESASRELNSADLCVGWKGLEVEDR